MDRMRRVLSAAVRLLGSFGLAVAVLLLLLVLTYLGTIDQVHMSLHEVQRAYFESFIVTDRLIIPMPGGMLLLSVLFVNLVVGGMLRMRRAWNRVGIFIIHIGIAVLLLGSLIEANYSSKGNVRLFEGDSADFFQSSTEWEVAILQPREDGTERVYAIPEERFNRLSGGRTARFEAEGLPFVVELSGYALNCEPRAVANRGMGGTDGIFLRELRPAGMDQVDTPGLSVAIIKADGKRREGLLWGWEAYPWTVDIGGKSYGITLRRKRWTLPFTVVLQDFQHEFHPGTGMPSRFSSDITRIESGAKQDVHISMNEPMRYGGYTFYQSGWGPQNVRNPRRFFSDLAVVRNPTDQVPLYACTVIAIGLLTHFLWKLFNYLRAESKRRERAGHAVAQ